MLFCGAGALSGGRKSVLYFNVSVSGQTYCLLEQILESYKRDDLKLIYIFTT